MTVKRADHPVDVPHPKRAVHGAKRGLPRLSTIRPQYLVVAGQAIGQLSLLAVIPVLTRAFSPAELGGYLVALSVAIIIQPLATLRVELVIPVSKSARSTRHLTRRSTYAITGATSLLCLAALVLSISGRTSTASTLLMTAMITASYSWMAVENALLIRAQQSRRLATRNLLSGLLSSLLQLVVALVVPVVFGLAAAVLAGRLFAIAVTRQRAATATAVGDGGADAAFGPRRTTVTVASGLVTNAVLQGLTLVSAILLGPGPAGYLGTAQRVSLVPVGLVGQGIAQAVQVTAAKAINSRHRRLGPSMLRIGVRLAALATVVALAMASLGPVLAVPVLGQEWAPVGTILPILAVPVAFQLVVSPLAPVLVMIGRENVMFVQQVIRLVASMGAAAAVAAATRSLIGTVTVFSLVTVISYVVYILLIIRCVREFDTTEQRLQ